MVADAAKRALRSADHDLVEVAASRGVWTQFDACSDAAMEAED